MKAKMMRRIAAAAVSLTVAAAGLPGSFVLTAGAAQDAVSYTVYSWDDTAKALNMTTKTAKSYTVVTGDLVKNSSDGTGAGLTSGTYVVMQDTVIEDYVYIRKGCTVNLVIPEGVTLTCKKGIGCGYDKNKSYATLNICGSGKLISTGDKYVAGIGGKDDEANGVISIHGTTVEATGGKHGAGIGGGEGGQDPNASSPAIRIYAGDITATGGIDGAGIGGGDCQPGARTYIYSGTVNASSEKHGAGIGGGDEEGTFGVFIYGGTVMASGGAYGAGIGAGEEGGNLRKAENGGGINIFGGDVTAVGGKGGAGIGGGAFEDVSGTILISGEDTKVTATGGDYAAGIGAGDGDGSGLGFQGDMDGTVTVDCGTLSSIIITGGTGGAGIGAGVAGNMNGKFYMKGGNAEVYGGELAAGIGGGHEIDQAGGEGGTAYIGGGSMMIVPGGGEERGLTDKVFESDAEAIGKGDNDLCSGTVYITSNKNGTGKYMRVSYCGTEKTNFQTVKSGSRSSKCHSHNKIQICECPHTDYSGADGLTYTVNQDGTHTAECKYCGMVTTEPHNGSDCECGYSNPQKTVMLSSTEGLTSFTIASGKTFVLPNDEGEIIKGNTVPTSYFIVKGWNDDSGAFYEAGSEVTVTRDMEFYLLTEQTYLIECSETENGQMKADLSYAKAGETVEFSAEPDPECTVSKVTYTYITDYDGEYIYAEPVEIPETDGGYRLTVPELAVPANGIIVSAEIQKNPGLNIYISDSENGHLTASTDTPAEGETVILTVQPEEGFRLERIHCKKADGTEIELTQLSSTEYSFIMPAESVSVSAIFEEAAPSAVLNSANISLGGELGLNFYLTVPDDIAADAAAVMNGPEGKAESPLTKQNGVYQISYPVKAIHADQTVTVSLTDSSGNVIDLYHTSGERITDNTFAYSIYDYVTKAMQLDETYVTAAEKKQIQAMYTYAAYSVKWKYGTALPADGYINALPDTAASELEGYRLSAEGGANVEITGGSLVLDSQTSFKLYFRCSTVPEITLDGKNVTAEKSGNQYYIIVRNIGAGNLSRQHTAVFGGSYTVTFSVLSYPYTVLKNRGSYPELIDDVLCDLVKAIYAYSKAYSA